MTREDAVKLLRACAVLYYGADEEMIRLAENEFSGCASTQRNVLNELEIFLKKEARSIISLPENKNSVEFPDGSRVYESNTPYRGKEKK